MGPGRHTPLQVDLGRLEKGKVAPSRLARLHAGHALGAAILACQEIHGHDDFLSIRCLHPAEVLKRLAVRRLIVFLAVPLTTR